MIRGITTAVLAVTITAALAAPSAGLASTTGCGSPRHVLARTDGIVIWSKAKGSGPVYVCRTHAGTPRMVYSQSSSPSVVGLRSAGKYVGFFLWTNIEVYSKYLVVFNKANGRIEFEDLAECDGNDQCTGPNMTGFRLAGNGWVVEVWPFVGVLQLATGLLATNGGPHYQLDLGNVSDLALSNGTLSWTSAPFDHASVRLGPGVITPATAGNRSACQLFTRAELAPLLGPSPTSSSSSTGQCTYSNASGRTLKVRLTTGLTPSQMQARENAASGVSGSYCNISQWWPGNTNFDDLPGCSDDGAHYTYASFSNGAELLLDLTKADSHGEVELDHLSTFALDRLFGVPITRS